MADEHPFAPYVRILGRGRSKSRSLTEAEARSAMAMILADEVTPEQLGAFLMLVRVKEETPEEIAGFVRASRETLRPPAGVSVDLDWSSYAGKKRQLPWFVLAALALAGDGVRILMHGAEGHTPDRLYTREALESLGLPIARSFDDAARHLATVGFAYLPLEHASPSLDRIIGLRPVLGLRSPVHTIARMLNPFRAPCSLQGIFHPGYLDIHQAAACLLGEPRMAVFRGEGGEVERRPNKPAEVRTARDGVAGVTEWPAMLADSRRPPDGDMDLGRLRAVWRDTADDDYATAAIVGTLAIALHALGRADGPADAEAAARVLWRGRDRKRLGAAA